MPSGFTHSQIIGRRQLFTYWIRQRYKPCYCALKARIQRSFLPHRTPSAFAMPAKVAFICFYCTIKYFQMRAAVKDKQAQPVEIISCGIFIDADQLGCRFGGNACNE